MKSKSSYSALASKENTKTETKQLDDLQNRAKMMFSGLDDEDMNTFADPTSKKASEKQKP